jgi:putative transposase
MDETYVKVRCQWVYLYCAVDRDGKTLDFMLSERRDTAAATQFFAKTLAVSGISMWIVIDKSGANGAGIKEVSKTLRRFGCPNKSAPSELATQPPQWSNFGNKSATHMQQCLR